MCVRTGALVCGCQRRGVGRVCWSTCGLVVAAATAAVLVMAVAMVA